MGLTLPSESLSQFICDGFAMLDLTDSIIMKYKTIAKTDEKAFWVLDKYLTQNIKFTCEIHAHLAKKICIKTVIKVFYNNKQKRSADDEREDRLISFKKSKRKKSFHDS